MVRKWRLQKRKKEPGLLLTAMTLLERHAGNAMLERVEGIEPLLHWIYLEVCSCVNQYLHVFPLKSMGYERISYFLRIVEREPRYSLADLSMRWARVRYARQRVTALRRPS